MAQNPTSPRPTRTYLWWLVLGLVGLDYFSTLAYLPSMAVKEVLHLAPVAALGVVLATLLGAVPVYLYVVGRSPDGHGAIGVLDRLLHGWRGKLLILILLGFVATDFIVTRSLSLADATVHLLHNPYFQDHSQWIAANKETVRGWFPGFLRGGFFNFWNEQLVVTVVLAMIVFAFWALLHMGFTPQFLRLAIVLVGLYLLLNALVIGSGVVFLVNHPDLFAKWWQAVVIKAGVDQANVRGLLLYGLAMAGLYFPYLVLGLSGFELTMASAPLVRGRPDDDPRQPRGRIRNTRKLMLVAALIMSVFLVGSVLVTTILVPEPTDANVYHLTFPEAASNRALAFLAHGGLFGKASLPNLEEPLNPLFGPGFGTLYDVATILVLVLAGASVSIGFRDLLPYYLARYGMQLRWAQRVGVITHLFNLTVLIVIVFFKAEVADLQWAYATSVLVLLTGAALAAMLDVGDRWRKTHLGVVAALPFGVILFFFLVMTGYLLYLNRSGLAIAVLLILVLLVTAFVSRWLRSTELRFQGFTFSDDHSRQRWEEIRRLHFQVLVPHRPESMTLAEKEQNVRRKHRLAADVPIIFVEVVLGDPSDFSQVPLMEIFQDSGLEVIRVSKCASVAHVLAAIGLEFREVGEPPEIHFDWSDEPPLAANLNFLLMGQGNVPWMVHALIRKAEPDRKRQPRVVIG